MIAIKVILIIMEPLGTSDTLKIANYIREANLSIGIPLAFVGNNRSNSRIRDVLSELGEELVAIIEPRKEILPTLLDMEDLYAMEILPEIKFPLITKAGEKNHDTNLALMYNIGITDNLQKRIQTADNLVRGPPLTPPHLPFNLRRFTLKKTE